MDGDSMFSLPVHPIRRFSYVNDSNVIVPYVLHSQASMKYYFIDFGMSSYFPTDAPFKLVTGKLGCDREVPKLSDDVPYDPFFVDIFSIGNVPHTKFYDVSAQASLAR